MVQWGCNAASVGAGLIATGALAILRNEGPVGLRHPLELTGLLGRDPRRARWSHYLLPRWDRHGCIRDPRCDGRRPAPWPGLVEGSAGSARSAPSRRAWWAAVPPPELAAIPGYA